jgi:peptidyl-prolyl cis-trans isomerase SurA
MGYMHIGMFGTPAQKVLNVMEPGEISEPVVLLEGVALFRLNDVQEASLNTFGDVEERARNLLMRELGEKAWKDLQTALRQSADIKYSDLIIEDLNLNMTSDNAS